MGSDLLNEGYHLELLAGFIDQHAKKRCEVIHVDPGHGLHARFSKKMVHLDYSHTRDQILRYLNQHPGACGCEFICEYNQVVNR